MTKQQIFKAYNDGAISLDEAASRVYEIDNPPSVFVRAYRRFVAWLARAWRKP